MLTSPPYALSAFAADYYDYATSAAIDDAVTRCYMLKRHLRYSNAAA